MIDSDEVLVDLFGTGKVAAFKEVKRASMTMARVIRSIIADDLGGTLPPTGKQFLTTSHGEWRLATRPNSDNSTERAAHRAMGVRPVQVFGELSQDRRNEGWIDVAELYRIHHKRFSERTLRQKVVRRLSEALPGE